ncbi:MAG TPA: protein translocase subunit SecF [Methanobacterium sp.]|jgi:preprotein translocase subunit SecF|nr:MAG: protein translocase subunit SecF [Methanobacterium sp.]HOI71153.1 protein translocase subunit SecF [Methanobacterium sp.]
MSYIDKFLSSYKPLIAIPVIITVIALIILATNGLTQGIDLTGGTNVIIELQQDTSPQELQTIISNGIGIDEVEVTSIANNQATVDIIGEVDVVELTNVLAGVGTISSLQSVGALLSERALTQVYYAIAFAFLFMAITVFIVFREFVPSIAVILAALTDIIISLGGMSLFGIPLSIASVGAILMLIGYSVDTDILLTTRVLKNREGTVNKRVIDAMKTGFTMAAASIGSMVTLYLVVVYFMPFAHVLSQIASVLIIGLVADTLATWLMNLGILRWYMEARR